jgi:hypothetical protein
MSSVLLHRFAAPAARAALALTLAALLPAAVPTAHAQLGTTMPAAPPAGSAPVANHLLDASVRVRGWTDEGGTTIHEYATADGLIFAYTWQGPTMPDLHRLLGAYLASYRVKADAQREERGSLHASRVAQPDVVVDSGGQMRSYVGRAWLPGVLPPGVSPAELR